MHEVEQAAVLASVWAGLATAVGAALVFLGAGGRARRPCPSDRGFRSTLRRGLATPAAQAGMLGFTAGVMVMVAVGSLLPEAWSASRQARSVVMGVTAGVVSLAALDWLLVHHLPGQDIRAADYRQGLLSLVALALHNLPEGMAVAVAYLTPHSRLGPLLALGIALHNLPEGLAISTPLAAAGLPAWRAWEMAALTGLMEPLAALGTIGLLQLAQRWDWQGIWFARGSAWSSAYGLAAGAMMYVVLVEILPAVGRHRLSQRLAAGGLLTGVLLMGIAECWLG
ncbi:MAG: ZIP family metal transporter [Limnochordaceae bacterium]|nr:ZIP family metal transporter [Limnochordaceae bacterium]